MPTPAPRVVVVGSANVDLTMRVARLPAPGETVTGGTFEQVFGGKGANAAVAAARASGVAGDVAFVARVGDDAAGRQMVANFADDGIDCRHVAAVASPSGSALILIDARGENCIAVSAGANDLLTPADVDAAAGLIGGAAYVLLQLEIPPDTVARAIDVASDAAARTGGAKVLLNYAPVREPAIDYSRVHGLVVNESEAAALAALGTNATTGGDVETAARTLLGRGPSFVVVTLGARGALAADSAGLRRFEPFDVTPVDATAAGDTFCGALAVALADGRGLDGAVRFAQAAAALCVTGQGAQPSIPTRERIDAMLAGTGASNTADLARPTARS